MAIVQGGAGARWGSIIDMACETEVSHPVSSIIKPVLLSTGGVMCAYSAENGQPSCANDFLLNKVGLHVKAAYPCFGVLTFSHVRVGAASAVAAVRCCCHDRLRGNQPPYLRASLRSVQLYGGGLGAQQWQRY